MYLRLEKPIAQLRRYRDVVPSGIAYRVDYPNWGIPRHASVADTLRFEMEELGNQFDGLTECLMHQLDTWPHYTAMWVCANVVDVRDYVCPYEDADGVMRRHETDISVYSMGSEDRIITEDSSGGYLVLTIRDIRIHWPHHLCFMDGQMQVV